MKQLNINFIYIYNFQLCTNNINIVKRIQQLTASMQYINGNDERERLRLTKGI